MAVPAGEWRLNPEPKSALVGTVWRARPEADVAEAYREVRIVGTVELGELGAEIAYAPAAFGAVESASAEWFAENYTRASDRPLDRLDVRFRALQEVAR